METFACLDHRDFVVALAKARGVRRGIEVGLGQGLLFERLLALGIEMIGVDLGKRADRRGKVQDIEERYGKLCKVIWLPSFDAADYVSNGWADFVFIDAGHSHTAVATDISRWQPKVKKGGWFGGHDYHPRFPGVVSAVNEAFGDRINVWPHAIWEARL